MECGKLVGEWGGFCFRPTQLSSAYHVRRLAEKRFGFINPNFPCMKCGIFSSDGYADGANGLMFHDERIGLNWRDVMGWENFP